MNRLPSRILCTALAAMTLAAWSSPAFAQELRPAVPGEARTAQVGLQPWQVRRQAFLTALKGAQAGNAAALLAFDAALTEFDTRPMNRTPMENMEILGVFYVPREGLEKALPVVAMNAVLGWYDTLRFASASGRAEIVNNEGFFKKVMAIGGPAVTGRALRFLETEGARASQLVEQGIAFAERYRETASYDRRWPTAYGLERLICAQDAARCEDIPSMPRAQWDNAWNEAVQRVRRYYRVTPPGPGADGGSSPP